ncbi:hypothetical protein GCM10023080_009240 [Streptomyces pseudoechinosporeus]
MEARDSKKVKSQTEQTSSRVLEIIDLKGKVTDTGATTTRCSDYSDDEEVYRAQHPWSIYDVTVEDMKQAMDRLRQRLPEQGWKIVKDGTDDSQAKSPQIVADTKDGDFSVDIRLQDESKYGDDPSLLEVTVESACYRSKQ